MSVSNIVIKQERVLPPPPISTPLFVTGRDGKTIGQVDISKHLPWAAWFSQIEAFSTELMISATVDFGTIPAQDEVGETITLPFEFGQNQEAVVIPSYPAAAPDQLVITAYFALIGTFLIAVGHNYGSVGLTPGALNLNFRILPRRIT